MDLTVTFSFHVCHNWSTYFPQQVVAAGGVDRLTDTSKYTGSHRERFDESGKGKGLEGRKDFDKHAEAGYVGGYKGANTYDETH